MIKTTISVIARIIAILIFMFALYWCVLFQGRHIVRQGGNYFSDSKVTSAVNPREHLDTPMTMESTPIFVNNRLITVTSIRSAAQVDGKTKIRVDEFSDNDTKMILRSVGEFSVPDFGLISAVVHNDVVYVFGVTRWNQQNEIRVISSVDLMNWSEPRVVYRAVKDQVIFNTSVANLFRGGVIAYEVSEPGIEGFAPRFLKSDDFENWIPAGELFRNEESFLKGGVKYSACPTLRYLDGYFYMTYLAHQDNQFVTLVARSKDLISWEYADKPLFVPENGEGSNNSDVDFVEALGNIYFLYHTGDQQTWGNLKRAKFHGSLRELLQQFSFSSAKKLLEMNHFQ